MTYKIEFDINTYSILSEKETPEMDKRKKMVEMAVCRALENRSFQVYYQPIWDRRAKLVHSAEALLRLNDEELGFISPEEFIPIAEQNGMIIDIGVFVFEEACRFYKEKKLLDMGIDYIEINLSVVQCMSSELVDRFGEILSRYELDAGHFNLEITESAVTFNRATLKRTIRALADRGFAFSLDDYGTGYSNVSFMINMPFSIIKIDKSILWSAMHPQLGAGARKAMVLLENTVKMLQEMNYQIVVEGVETEEQKMLLENLKCDYFQGFLFSRPLPGYEFTDCVAALNT